MTPLRSALRAAALVVAVVSLGACTDSNSAVLGADSGSQNSAARSTVESLADVSQLPSSGAPAPTRHTGPQGVVGQFVTDCALSHSAPDDPIVYPDNPAELPAAPKSHSHHGVASATGQEAPAGHSHMHNFFGNTSTDSASTLATLLKSGTTCKKKLDTAAYWAPELRDHGNPITPTKSTAYYRAAPGVDPTLLVPYPEGLKIIAGDSTATSERPQSADLAGWGCGTSSTLFPAPPDCPASAPLRGVITFPDCWDGVSTDSPDHRSHMANSSGGLCPASHPVHVPQLTFAITYPISGTGHDLTLASGETYGLHSDFINSWHQPALEQEIDLCLHRGVVCALSSNRGEESLFTG